MVTGREVAVLRSLRHGPDGLWGADNYGDHRQRLFTPGAARGAHTYFQALGLARRPAAAPDACDRYSPDFAMGIAHRRHPSPALAGGWNGGANPRGGTWTPDGKYFIFEADRRRCTQPVGYPRDRGFLAQGQPRARPTHPRRHERRVTVPGRDGKRYSSSAPSAAVR